MDGCDARAFAFRMPDVQIPEMPSMTWGGEMGVLSGGVRGWESMRRTLAGNWGSFFGAPDGEGILVRSVNSGSPAEKPG